MQHRIIGKELWSICRVCKKSLAEMKTPKPGRPCYKTEKMKSHLAGHGLSVDDYFKTFCGVDTGKCPCGCGSPLPISIRGPNFVVVKVIRWHHDPNNEGWKKFIESEKIQRIGSGNPMYGKKAWNSGLTKHDSPILKAIADKRIGIVFSPETREKMSAAGKKRLVSGHAGHHHTEETKAKLRQLAINQIKNCLFPQTRTKPHIAFAVLLDRMRLAYAEEQQHGPFSFDFFVEKRLYVEVDGDYFHSNPVRYPNGPVTKTQKINAYRDMAKDKYAKQSGLNLIRVWESEILTNEDSVRGILEKVLNECASHSSR